MSNYCFRELHFRHEKKLKNISCRYRFGPVRSHFLLEKRVFLSLQRIQITSKHPFDRFKTFFDVIGNNNKKVGSLEL